MHSKHTIKNIVFYLHVHKVIELVYSYIMAMFILRKELILKSFLKKTILYVKIKILYFTMQS